MPDTFIGRGVVRKLWAGDRDALVAHLLRLDPASRHMRFQGLVSEAAIEKHAQTAIRLDTVIYGYFDDGVLRAAAELHPIGQGRTTEAEAAFSVEREYQYHGIGTELFRRLTVAARNRGIRRLVLHCLAGNLPMRRLVDRFENRVTIEDGEVTAVIAAARPTPLSLFSEAVADGTGLAKAMLDAELRLLRAAA